ncbi:MAG: DUF6495 family protein [Brumimicrobium sp.]|nr:DUF6495 family protein [Brumimicrobium sp.]
MPKYGQLTREELTALEKEFVEFLVINGVSADQWKQLKQNSPDKAEGVIEQFSDVVWEGVLRKIRFLEFRSKNEIKTFQCLQDKIVLMGLKINKTEVDLSSEIDYEALRKNPPLTNVYSLEKKYEKNRETEIFEMIENGCFRSDGTLFKQIALAVAEKTT